MALRDVNLIPGEILERRSLIRHLLLWLGSLVAVALILLGIYEYQNPGAYRGDKNLKADLARTVGEIGKEQQKLNLARRERERLGALIEQRRSYAAVLAKLAEVMNDETWLLQLTVDTGRDGQSHLGMTGFSFSHASLGMFIERLSGEPMFRLVVLKSAQEAVEKLSGSNPVQFQIECDLAKEAP